MLFNYTTELRTFFENLPVNADQSLPHAEVIENGRSKLFDFNYPIFDEDYKKVFETHFIRKFYMRQIGFETFGLFKFQLETWLIINMPYFNKMFESELMKYDPLTNTKLDVKYNRTKDKNQNDTRDTTDTKTIDGETQSNLNRTVNVDASTKRLETSNNEGVSSTTGNTETSQSKNETDTVTDDNFSRKLDSNNPDSRLSITANDGEGVIEYANNIKEDTENNTKTSETIGTNTGNESSRLDNANKESGHVVEDSDTDSTTSDIATDNVTTDITQTDTKNDSLTSSINDIEDYVEQRVGKVGVQSFAKLVQEYRAALIRVENEIFDEMNELFMLVY